MFASTNFWASVLASTTPVLFATLATSIAYRAGVFNLAVEGTMLMSALAGVFASAFTGSLLIGMLAGLAVGVLTSFVLGYFALVMDAPANACGVAINLIASGGTVFLISAVCDSKNNTTSLISSYFPAINIPVVQDIPFVGAVVSGQNLLTYLSWFSVLALGFLLYRTKLGAEIRAVGEHKAACQAMGVNVLSRQFMALGLCGVFCGFGGMYLSMGALHSFTAGMVAGRGYLSLALDAIAAGNPYIGAASSFLYGFANTIAVYLQLNTNLDLQLINAFPYLFIVLVLVVVQVTRSRMSKSHYAAKLAAAK